MEKKGYKTTIKVIEHRHHTWWRNNPAPTLSSSLMPSYKNKRRGRAVKVKMSRGSQATGKLPEIVEQPVPVAPVAALEDESSALRRENSELRDANVVLSSALTELGLVTTRNSKLEVQNQRLKEENELLREENERLREENERLKEENERLKKELKLLREMNSQLQVRLDQMEEKMRWAHEMALISTLPMAAMNVFREYIFRGLDRKTMRACIRLTRTSFFSKIFFMIPAAF